MISLTNTLRVLLCMLGFAAFIPAVHANAAPVFDKSGTNPAGNGAVAPQPAGSPEMGILIIIGVIGILILVAWIFSRVSDDARSPGDSTLI